MTEEEGRWLCFECMGDAFLKAKIKVEGERQRCSFCHVRRKSMSLDDLADIFETTFEQHLYRTSDQPSDFESLLMKESDYDWDRSGDPVLEVLQELGEIDEKVAEGLRGILSERHSSYDEYFEEDDFDEGSYYAYTSVDTREMSAAWQNFTDDLKTGSRYFSKTAEATLAELFDSIHEYKTEDGRGIIVEAGPGTDFASLYRARVFQNSEHLKIALKRPDLEIGSPPSKLAAAGRMNARGISVFYGALHPEIARAEVRPFVGSRVAIAKFELIRPLNLLDIKALKTVTVKGSLFDPAYGAKLEKVKFLGTLSQRMTAPVMPDDEPFDYLPTQAIADFLAAVTNPRLDGIIYPSVQGAEGMKNVVLFHKAAMVEAMTLPEGTEITAQLETATEDGPEIDYWVWEETPSEGETKTGDRDEQQNLTVQWSFSGLSTNELRQPALRIVPDSVMVHHITGIEYATDTYGVKRHRSMKRENKF